MKKIFLVIALVMLVMAASAEGTQPKPSCAGFVSNGFWDNWEVSGAIGVQTAITNGKDLGAFGQSLGFEGNLSVLKWIHPVAGVRLQLQGGFFNNYDAQYGKMEWPYLFAHIDFMANLSNWIGGYRDDRAYYAVPFLGMGYMTANMSDKSHIDNHTGTTQNFAFSYGVLNKFRMSPSVDFNIELKGLLVPAGISPVKMGGSYLFGFSATAGFTYRFNKRGWQRGSVSSYSAEDLRACQQAAEQSNAALAAAQTENANLNKELQAAREAAAKPEVTQAQAAMAAAEAAQAAAEAAKVAAEAAKAASGTPAQTVETSGDQMVILYDLKSWMLTPKELSRLNVLANTIKKGPQDRVYHIEGHADRQTGIASTNKRLADERAKGVYNYLIRKGIDPKQLTYEGKGDTANPFDEQRANRAVIIK